jgi:hypothetical protein
MDFYFETFLMSSSHHEATCRRGNKKAAIGFIKWFSDLMSEQAQKPIMSHWKDHSFCKANFTSWSPSRLLAAMAA